MTDKELVDAALSRVTFVVSDHSPHPDLLGGAPWFDAVERHARATTRSERVVTMIAKKHVDAFPIAGITRNAKRLAQRIMETSPGWRIKIMDAHNHVRDNIRSTGSYADGSDFIIGALIDDSVTKHLDHAHMQRGRRGSRDITVQLAPPIIHDASGQRNNVARSGVAFDMDETPAMPDVEPGMAAKLDLINDHELGHAVSWIMGFTERDSAYDKYLEEMRADGFAVTLSILRHGSDEPARQLARDRNEALFFGRDTIHWSADILPVFAEYGQQLRESGETVDTVDLKALMATVDTMVDANAMSRHGYQCFEGLVFNTTCAMSVPRIEVSDDIKRRFSEACHGFVDARRERLEQVAAYQDGGLREWTKGMIEVNPESRDLLLLFQGIANIEAGVDHIDKAHAHLSVAGRHRPKEEAIDYLTTITVETREVLDILYNGPGQKVHPKSTCMNWKAKDRVLETLAPTIHRARDTKQADAVYPLITALKEAHKTLPQEGGDLPFRLSLVEKTLRESRDDHRRSEAGVAVNPSVIRILRGATAASQGLAALHRRPPRKGGLVDRFHAAALQAEEESSADRSGLRALRTGYQALSQVAGRLPSESAIPGSEAVDLLAFPLSKARASMERLLNAMDRQDRQVSAKDSREVASK